MNGADQDRQAEVLSDRYSRQVVLEFVGQEGQARLLASRAVLIGCGALGGVLANTLVRAGLGYLRLVDRDFVEVSDLQRHALFDERDLVQALPKAEAARRKLAVINSSVTVEAEVADVDPTNIERLIEGADVVLDGTDNFETRYLINDAAVKRNVPWVYGACLGASGLMMPVVPGQTPCLRCVFAQPPPPELTPTCETSGILAAVVNMVASLQAVEAMKILMGQLDALNRHLVSIDAWSGRVVNLDVQSTHEQGDCVCCKQRKFEYLEARKTSRTVVLCGRDAVQIRPAEPRRVDLKRLADKVRPVATTPPTFSDFMLRVGIEPYFIAVFADGRAIIKGTSESQEARAVYAKYIGG